MGVAALALASVAAVPVAQAAFPPAKNGRIAFNRSSPGVLEGYLMNLDGTGLFSPTATLSGGDSGPGLSANGTRIVVSHDMDPTNAFRGDIFILNINGTGALNLTNTAESEGEPRISPDGRQVLFTRNPPVGETDFFLINSDGSNLRNLTASLPGDNTGADFSADGRRILFDGDSDPGMAINIDVMVMNVDGTGVTNLTTGSPLIDQAPRFSPDGERIVFNRRPNFDFSDVLIMNADGSGQTKLTNTAMIDEFSPVFSPDGKRIAFSRAEGVAFDGYVMNANGSGLAPLITGSDQDFPSDWEPVYRCGGRRARIVGSDASETLKGTKKADAIVGNGGRDRILGRSGNDRLCGGRGNDLLVGGGGENDRLLGGKGKDKQRQ